MIGWIGSALLALCGLPEAVKAIQEFNCSLTWAFLGMWGLGEVFALIYVLQKNKEVKLIPLICNYGANIFFITIMIVIKLIG